ncbi:hypothetical protein GCM10010420_43860 [Streptomyces glaucosporus]|uniref:Uncharacterized protein n=1 Tax=Streptomyces glaucosporus TaxID=284044 RepID=A0ABN3IPS6_9ACTN
MGTDINGFVECRCDHRLDDDGEPFWHAVADLEHLLRDHQDHDAFRCLFGVRGRGPGEPPAERRGLPGDVSDRTRAEYGELGGHSASWITWAELEAVDWDGPLPAPDPHVHVYRRTPGGEWERAGRGSEGTRFAEVAGLDARAALLPGLSFPVGTEWRDGDLLFRVEPLTRRLLVREENWGTAWAVMRSLAERHGGDLVRLVVWFT